MDGAATLADSDSDHSSYFVGSIRVSSWSRKLVWHADLGPCPCLLSRRDHPISTISAASFVLLDGREFQFWLVVLFCHCLPNKNPGGYPSAAWRSCSGQARARNQSLGG